MKESLRTPVSDCRLLPSRRPPSDQHRQSWPRNCLRAKNSTTSAPFPTGCSEAEFEFRWRGTTFLGISTGGARARADLIETTRLRVARTVSAELVMNPRGVHRRRLLVDGSRPTGGETLSEFPTMLSPASRIRFPTTMNCSYGISLATNNRLIFRPIGGESNIGRRTPPRTIRRVIVQRGDR